MNRHRLALSAALSLFASTAVAAPKAPWKMPKSDYGGAEPLNAREWYTFKDYPSSALSGGEQGLVTVTFTINTEGSVSDCRVAKSSGYSSLDAVPCALLISRAKFKPAVDAQGQPKATIGTTSMSFWMPYR